MRQYLVERRYRDINCLISQTLIWARDEVEALKNASDMQPVKDFEYLRIALIRE